MFNKSQTTLIQYPTGAGRYGVSYTIPDTVTTVADRAFMDCGLTKITIPDSVTSIGNSVFNNCGNLSRMTIPDSVTNLGSKGFFSCQNLISVTIGNGVPSIEQALFQNCRSLRNLTIGGSVTNIAGSAFSGCTGLTNVTIPASVNSIGAEAFSDCTSLKSVYFLGDAPSADATVFDGDNMIIDYGIVYYLPGMTGWGSTFGGAPTAEWLLPHPLILNNEPTAAAQSNNFAFTISWATNTAVVVEVCTNLANPLWLPVATNILTNGSSYFSEPLQTNSAGRFYRIAAP